MKNLKALSVLTSLFFCSISNSQTISNSSSANLSESVGNYFKLDREIIHLHLNKTQYLTTDKVWFKGYITEKKTGTPYPATVNVYVKLLNEQGQTLQSGLYYAENSIFEGNLSLAESYPTGIYFVQAYTNYMNNFTENESSVFKITIINPMENKIPTDQINYGSVEPSFYPESGVFLKGTSNTIVVKLTDCNGRGVAITDGRIEDPKGALVTTFTTTASGFGKFDILTTSDNVYKAVYTLNGQRTEKMLPVPSASGITFSANSYAVPNKTVIKIKTNAETLKNIANKPYALILQKADAVAVIDVSFKDNLPEQNIAIPATELSEGITAIYLTDADLKKIGERVIFSPVADRTKTKLAVETKRSDSIIIRGESPLKLGAISVSVLPVGTASNPIEKSIYATMLFDAYLAEPIANAPLYINEYSRRKHFELDNMLIANKSKYDWDAIRSNTAVTEKFTFDSGVAIKGTVNNISGNPGEYRVRMNSILEGNTYSKVNEKNEFYFDKLIVADSTQIHFSLIDKKNKDVQLKMYPQMVNNIRSFPKTFSANQRICVSFVPNNEPFPKTVGAIMLNDVSVKAKAKRDSLTNLTRFGNGMSRGFKISDSDAASYPNILSYIQARGYIVSTENGSVSIKNNGSRSFSGSNSPAVFVDNMPLPDLSLLQTYNMKDVDEIYFNKHGYGMGSGGGSGLITIYMKKPSASTMNVAIRSQSFFVTNGFRPWPAYKNPSYSNMHDQAFKKYGTLHWIPNINTDANGMFKIAIPNAYQQKVQLTIEGISSAGELLSETILLDIP